MTKLIKQLAIAEFKIWMISKASWLSEGKTIDWTDWDQRKYYPWFDLSPSSGSGFSSIDYYYDIAFSHVGSRRVFPTKEICKHLCENVFFDLFKTTFTLPKEDQE